MLIKKTLLIFLTISLLSSISYAEDSIYLSKGQTATFNGYLLPETEVQTLRNNTFERDAFKTANDAYKAEINLYQTNIGLKDQQLSLTLDQNNKLAKALNENRSLNNWERVAFFAGGILVVGLAIYGVRSIYK
jgi:hypothetical protein